MSKLHRPVRAFPSSLTTYAINFAYEPNAYNYTSPFLSEAVFIPNLAKQICEFLKTLPQDVARAIPLQKNIVCVDVINPHAIPHIELIFDEASNMWEIPKTVPISRYTLHNFNLSPEEILNSGKYTLIQDDKFLLAIRDLPEKVELYIYKK